MDDGAEIVSVKALVLEEFPMRSPGSGECRRILHDWFDRAAKSFGQDTELYDEEVWQAANILMDIRAEMSSVATARNASVSELGRTSDRLWSWPDQPLYTRGSACAADNSGGLERALALYVQRPWLQHDLIDASAINVLLFEKLAHFSYQMRTGELTGQPNWGAVLSGGNLWAEIGLNLVLPPVRVFLRWLMLPLAAWALIFFGYERPAMIAIAVWALYLLFRLLRTPARWRKRKAARETSAAADKYFEALAKAWTASGGSVVNPARLRELVLAAEACGMPLPAVLHTIIDRAIQRDPTALSRA